MTGTGKVLKWLGAATVVFGVVPFVVILARDAPGMIREVKIGRMGMRGGWKQAH